MNIKNVLSLTLLLATPVVFAADVKPVVPAKSVAKEEIKVGYFSSSEAVGKSKIGQAVYAEIEKMRSGFEATFKKKYAALKTKADDYKVKAPTMNEQTKKKIEMGLTNDENELKVEASGYEEDLKSEMNKKQDEISKCLYDAAKKAGTEAGVDLLRNVDSDLVINPEKITMTSKIIKNMDAAYSKTVQPKKPVTAAK